MHFSNFDFSHNVSSYPYIHNVMKGNENDFPVDSKVQVNVAHATRQ